MRAEEYIHYLKLFRANPVGFTLNVTNKFFLMFMEVISVRLRNWKKPAPGECLDGKRILIIRHGGIGDLLFISSILKEIKFRYPTSHIALMTRISYHALFANFQFADEILNHAWPNIFKLFQYDFVIFLDRSIEIDPDAERMNVYDLFAEKYFAMPIEEAGKKRPVINCIPDNRHYIRSVFPFIEDGNINIAVQIRAGSPVRTPSAKFYADTLSLLANSLPYSRIFILEERSNAHYAETVRAMIQEKTKNKMDIYNFGFYSRDINDLTAMISFMNLIIAPDSSVTHIAAGMGIPTIGIYGPFPADLRVRYYDSTVAVDAPYQCAPCFTHGHRPCPQAEKQGINNSPCFDQIDRQSVVEEAKGLIAASAHPGYGADLIRAFHDFLNDSKALNLWRSAKKVYVIAPARSCSTILTQYLNIHPEIKIFNEALWDKIFIKNYSSIDRLAHFCTQDKEKTQVLIEYYHANPHMEFEDLLGFLCSCNPQLWKMVQTGKVIGNKDPFFHRDICDTTQLIEYLAQRGWHFIGIVKTRPYQFIPSMERLKEVHPERKKVKDLYRELDYYAERLAEITYRYGLLDSRRILMKTYDEFVNQGSSIFNEFAYFLTQNHDIDLSGASPESIKKKIGANLSNRYLGSTNFIYDQSGLLPHHLSILEPIRDKNKDVDLAEYIRDRNELERWETALSKLDRVLKQMNACNMPC